MISKLSLWCRVKATNINRYYGHPEAGYVRKWKRMFLTVICLIVDVVIIDRPKQSGYSKKAVMGYEGTSFSRRVIYFL
jgi:hypothetical protein